MSNTEIPRFIVAIQNNDGQNVGFEVRPERPDGNGGFVTCMARPATIDDLRAVLTGEEAELALAGAAANARADAAEQRAATATVTLVERDAELAELRAADAGEILAAWRAIPGNEDRSAAEFLAEMTTGN